jgi:hypothetical protein
VISTPDADTVWGCEKPNNTKLEIVAIETVIPINSITPTAGETPKLLF